MMRGKTGFLMRCFVGFARGSEGRRLSAAFSAVAPVMIIIVISLIAVTPSSAVLTDGGGGDGNITVNASVMPPEADIGSGVRVRLCVESTISDTEYRGVDVVLVTDLSGSMNRDGKIDAAKEALHTFIDLASDDMYIGLASFSNADRLYSEDTWDRWVEQEVNGSSPFHPYECFNDTSKCSPSQYHDYYGNGYSDANIDAVFTRDKALLHNTVSSYRARGGTNIAGGINAARKMFNESGNASHLKVIVLMSDGIATMAPVEPDSLLAYMPSDWVPDRSQTARIAALKAADAAKSEGIIIYAIGFGSDADEETLQEIATSEDHYYFAPDSNDLVEIYNQIVTEIKETAKNVRVVYVPPSNVTYIGNASVAPDISTENTVQWFVGDLNDENRSWCVEFDVLPSVSFDDVAPDITESTSGCSIEVHGEKTVNVVSEDSYTSYFKDGEERKTHFPYVSVDVILHFGITLSKPQPSYIGSPVGMHVSSFGKEGNYSVIVDEYAIADGVIPGCMNITWIPMTSGIHNIGIKANVADYHLHVPLYEEIIWIKRVSS
ncbi:MAG: VWA domain-containing protein [Canidatus Methanoxibalbensis ujae]|nr:VWA domain-containing protein [Candidatus Methanoxibalbensis ujae]